MFFIVGITSGEKKLNFYQNDVCKCCGRNGVIEVFMTYMCLTLFFIPIFKWNKQYYVKMSCCNSICPIDNEMGRDIEDGRIISIFTEGLNFEKIKGTVKICNECGYTTTDTFIYCPKCGRKFN